STPPMCSGAGDTTQLVPGYPIRTPWDHSSVDSSPRPIAASHVLHRLLVPRHPPFALDNLTTKMLASTVQFSTNNQPTTHTPPPNQHPTGTPHRRKPTRPCGMEARSRLDRKNQPPPRQPTPPVRNPTQRIRNPTQRSDHTVVCSFRTQQGAHRRPPAAPD